MNNVIQFAYRPRKEYPDSDLVCLFTIMQGLSVMFGNDNISKCRYIKEHCPRLSRAMSESFRAKVETDCKKHGLKQTEPDQVPEWMTR